MVDGGMMPQNKNGDDERLRSDLSDTWELLAAATKWYPSG